MPPLCATWHSALQICFLHYSGIFFACQAEDRIFPVLLTQIIDKVRMVCYDYFTTLGKEITMNIITITLNPAFDLHYYIPEFRAGAENYVEAVNVCAGGKSVNISRALCANGIPNTACIVMGRKNAEPFQAKLREEGIDYISTTVDGSIRENITVHDKDGKETRISLNSFSLSAKMLDQLYMDLHDQIRSDTVITLSGRLPNGIGNEEAKRFCCRLRELTPYLVVDSNSFSIADLIEISPWLIKPNESELQSLLDTPMKDFAQITSAAVSLCEQGIAQVLVTLGGSGAVFVGYRHDTHRRICATVTLPAVQPISTIGAGDSTIAGFLKGFYEHEPIEYCLKTAIAFGTAACLREGTAPPLPADVERIRSTVRVTVSV